MGAGHHRACDICRAGGYAEGCDAAPARADTVPFQREITGLADLPKPPLSEHPAGLSPR